MKTLEGGNDPKLLTAFVSLCILFLSQFVFLLAHDLFNPRQGYPMGWEYRSEYAYWLTRENLFFTFLFAIPTLIWHASDLMQRGQPIQNLLRKVTSYRPFVAVMLYGILGYAILASGTLYYLHCPPAVPESDFGFWCHENNANGMGPLLALPLSCLLILSFAKMSLAILSFSRKPA